MVFVKALEHWVNAPERIRVERERLAAKAAASRAQAAVSRAEEAEALAREQKALEGIEKLHSSGGWGIDQGTLTVE